MNLDAARDNLDAVDSSLGVTAGEWELGVCMVESVQIALGRRESPAKDPGLRSISSLLRGLSPSIERRILGGLLDKSCEFSKVGVLSK